MNDFLKNYYIIHNLPYGFDFYNQDLRQLREHKKWFLENKEDRLTELQEVYYAFCGKHLDYTPESLKGLGEFFLNVIDTEKLSPEEYAANRAEFPPEISIHDYKFTNRSQSLMIDVGIYLGEVMIRNHKNMEWEQYLPRNKRAAERGYMVININPHKLAPYLNPIWVTKVMAWKVADNRLSATGIYDLYNIYCERVAPEFMPDYINN